MGSIIDGDGRMGGDILVNVSDSAPRWRRYYRIGRVWEGYVSRKTNGDTDVAGPFRGGITRRFLASFLDVLLQLRGVDIKKFLAGILLSQL
jgi:hypothetical protein